MATEDRFIRRNVQAMEGYTPGEQPSDPNAIKLNTNENPYPPTPETQRILQNCEGSDLTRYPDPLAKELRTAISRLHGCDMEQVFAGNGSDEVLALCLRAFVEQDGSAGYFVPSYSLYPVLCGIRDIEAKPVELDEEFGWRMPQDYEASIFFLTNPNAPTSMLYSRDVVEQFCDEFDGLVVIDEAYVDFSSRSCMGLALSRENVLVARTLSKAYSLAGIRLGYLVGNPGLINALYKIKDSYNINTLTQRIARAAIQDQVHVKKNCDRIINTRQRFASGLKKLGFKVFPSETNFLWVSPPEISAMELFEHLKSVQIYVRHFHGPKTGNHLRITIGTDDEMDTCLEEIKRACNRS